MDVKTTARPTTKIKCKACGRTIDAIIVKDYYIPKPFDPVNPDVDQGPKFRKLIIKDHRRSIWKSRHCPNSGRKITQSRGYYYHDQQAR